MEQLLLILLKKWLSAMVACFTVVNVPQPATLKPAGLLPRMHSMSSTKSAPRQFAYVFKGKATYQGHSYAHAKVLVRAVSPHGNALEWTTTRADGSYSLVLALAGREKEPVTWELQAVTPDYKQVDLEGCQIILGDESRVTVEEPVEFRDS